MLDGVIYIRGVWATSWSFGSYAANKTTSFTVDASPPSVKIAYPSFDSVIRSSNVDVEWNGSDPVSGIDHFETRLDDNPWISTELNLAHTFGDIPDGNHTVTVKAVDKVGLSKEDSVSFIVNTSLIGGPGWTDDIIVFAAIAVAFILVIAGVLTVRRRRTSRQQASK
jgi:hypothetical protein